MYNRLKSKRKQFGKYVSSFKRKDNSFIQTAVDVQIVAEPKNTFDTFPNNFKSITKTFCPLSLSSYTSVTTAFLRAAPSLPLKSALLQSVSDHPAALLLMLCRHFSLKAVLTTSFLCQHIFSAFVQQARPLHLCANRPFIALLKKGNTLLWSATTNDCTLLSSDTDSLKRLVF
jgi:hypothetical protein